LAPRELEAVHLASEGFTNQEIAGTMGIGVTTTKLYLHRAAEKLGLSTGRHGSTRARLARWYGEHGHH